MAISAITKLERHAATIAKGQHARVHPGQPCRLSEAASIGDAIVQGDLYLEVVAAVPDGYRRALQPVAQLVPGNTQGSRHCLDSLDGIEMWLPPQWPTVTQLGPCLQLTQERTVLHPVHGNVTIPAGMTILCSYQREYDAELQRERRNAD